MPPLLGVCLALLSVATPLVWGYSSGAPSSARVCSSMLPGHGAPAKTTPMRYSLTVDGGTSIYTPGLPVTLTLSGGPFVGFMVRALTGTGNGVSGMNSMSPNVITKDCGPVKDTVTHSSGAEKTTVMFQFTPPVGTSGTIEFHVTVVQDYDIYWVKQRGLTLTPTEAGSGSITTKQPPVSVPQTTGVSSTTKVQPVSLPQTTVVSQTTQQKPVSLPQTTVVSPTDITTLTPSTSSSSTSSSTSEVTSKTVVNVSAPTARAHIPALTIAPSAIGSVPNAHNISLAPNIATASSLRLNDSNSVGNAKLQVLPTDTPPIPGRNVKAVDPLIKQIDNMSKAKKDNVVDKTKSGISVIGAKKGTEVEKKTGGTNAKTRPEHVVPVSNIYSSALTIELGSSAATPTSDLTPKNSGDFNPNGFKGNVQSVVPIDADATGAIQPSNRDIIVEPVKSFIPEKIDSVNDIANVGNVDAIVSENQTGTIPNDPACGITKGCFQQCTGDTCSYLVTWQDLGTGVRFELYGKPGTGSSEAYLALGLSADKRMGDDSVTECVASNGDIRVFNSYNRGYGNNRLNPPQLGLANFRGGYQNGVLWCAFTRQKSGNVQSEMFDLNQDWYLMLAKGSAVPGYILTMHSTVNLPPVSASQVDFQSATVQQGVHIKYPLVKAHGILMIIAWVLCVGVGILAARYYKNVWADKTFLGLKIWFQIHRACMVSAFVLNSIAFIIIFSFVKGYSEINIQGKQYLASHPVLGIIVTALCVINPLMSLVRPAPDHKNRPIFNWAHWGVGMCAYILSAITIYFGFQLPKSSTPTYAVYIMIVYVIYVIIFDVIFEMTECFSRRQKKVEAGGMEMSNKNGTDNGNVPNGKSSSKDQMRKMDKIKTFLLVLHIAVTGAFALVLALVVGLN